MRKLLAIALLAVSGLPLLSVLLFGAQTAELRLPACCRRSGAHHCAMAMSLPATSAEPPSGHPIRWRALSARCPYSPGTTASVVGVDLGRPAVITGDVPVVSHPAGVAQTECRRRIARDRARGVRGPPVPLAA